MHILEKFQASLLQFIHILLVFLFVNYGLHYLDVLLKLTKVSNSCLDKLVLREEFHNVVYFFYFGMLQKNDVIAKIVLVLFDLIPEWLDYFIASQLFVLEHFV